MKTALFCAASTLVLALAGCGSPPAVAIQESKTAESALSSGERLTIEAATATRLAGALAKGRRSLRFDFRVTDTGERTATFRAADGAPLMQVSFDGDAETVQIGDAQALHGPRGTSRTSQTPPVSSAEAEAMAKVWNHPSFALIQDISDALERHGGLDLSALPEAAQAAPANQLFGSCDFWKGLGCHWAVETYAPICTLNAATGQDWCFCMWQALTNGGVGGCYDCVQSWFRC